MAADKCFTNPTTPVAELFNRAHLLARIQMKLVMMAK
jgi:hypothetical protein